MIIVTLSSLVLGTVAGLRQTNLKRLLAFSTISHVGFIMIGLVTGSEASLSAMIFYLVQYTCTTVLTFIVIIAYENHQNKEVHEIVDVQGTGQYYKVLIFTFVLCLFSIAGIPPITGFYAKLLVLNSSIQSAPIISLVFITAIICSVISAAYYFKVIKIVMFDKSMTNQDTIRVIHNNNNNNYNNNNNNNNNYITSIHGYTIACLTAFICLFILESQLILNCTELVCLSLYLV